MTAWPLRALTKCLRFWRPPPVNLPQCVTACEWDYTPKPPFIIIDMWLEPQERARSIVKASTVDAACHHFAIRLARPLEMVHAIVDSRAMIVLAVSHENHFSGCAYMWEALARHHDPMETAILEVTAMEAMR